MHMLWHRTADDYSDPDAFTASLNATLEALRSVTWMLEKEQRAIPDFETWYERQQVALAQDPVMRWLKNSRTHVVHRGELETRSRMRVTVLAPPRETVRFEGDAPPLVDTAAVAETLATSVPAALRDEAILVAERTWVASGLPGRELLGVLAHGYAVLAGIVAEAHGRAGISMRLTAADLHGSDPPPDCTAGGRLPCMVSEREQRTTRLHLGRGHEIEIEHRSRTISREELEGFSPGFEFTPAMARRAGESLLDSGRAWSAFAVEVLRVQGFHKPMIMRFEDTESPLVPQLLGEAEDPQTRSLVIHEIAAELASEQVEAVVFIGEEASPGPPDAPNENVGALLVAVATRDGGQRTYRTPFTRYGSRVLPGRCEVFLDALPSFLKAVADQLVAPTHGCDDVRSQRERR